MNTDEVIIKNSKIAGQGIFARRAFKKGEVVLHWDIPQAVAKQEVDKMPAEEKNILLFWMENILSCRLRKSM